MGSALGVAVLVGLAGLLGADGAAVRTTALTTDRAFAQDATTTTSTTPRAPETTASTSTPTTQSRPSTTTRPPPPQVDASILALQRRLGELGYDMGTPDGHFGWRTYYTVMAFQKVEGLPRTGDDSASLRQALAHASPPRPFVPNGVPTRVEIDLDRQVLLLWQGGALARVLSVSTGSGARYCVDGDCDVAVTPTGTFHIGRKYPGMEVSRLGELYHPMYFYGGIAIHGSPSVPAYPASHGCVRVPMYAAASLFDQVPSGTTVYVVGHGISAKDVAPPPDIAVRPPNPPPPPEPVGPPPTHTPLTAPPSTPAPSTSTTLIRPPT